MPYEQISENVYRINGTLVAVAPGAMDGLSVDEVAQALTAIVAEATQ